VKRENNFTPKSGYLGGEGETVSLKCGKSKRKRKGMGVRGDGEILWVGGRKKAESGGEMGCLRGKGVEGVG